MDNPNPIRYSDLISPDNSIVNLIQQLDELIAKYEGLRSKIQGAAQQTAQSMNNLSGATEEQRAEIIMLYEESEKLAKHYEQFNKAEREAYRQKQSVIQATKEQTQIDKLLVEINNSAEGSYKRLSAQYRLNKIRLNEMSSAIRFGTKEGQALERESRLLYEEMSRLQQATGKYTLEVGHYQNALRGLPGPIGQVVAGFGQMGGALNNIASSGMPLGAKATASFSTILSGSIGIIIAFTRALTGAKTTLQEFEQANANLATILGVNRDKIADLTESAKDLGRTTQYTARQVTNLQTELAKLGFGKESIKAMQAPILNFATAVGANLADAAQVAGATLRAFNLTSADTEETLSTLAVATTKSALDFKKIQDSIGTVFPVANAFGVSVKDTIALLGTLANAGFDASTAATATRNILLNLANANGKLAQSIGGPVKSFEGMINALKDLREQGINLSEALELTDKRSVSAFTALLSGVESTKELRAALEDTSGELDRIASERMDTLEGASYRLKSAWEGLTLSFDASNGTLKQTIDWLAKLINKVRDYIFLDKAQETSIISNYTAQMRTIYEAEGKEGVDAFMAARRAELNKQLEDEKNKGFIRKMWSGFGQEETIAEIQSGFETAAEQFNNFVANQEAEAARQEAQRLKDVADAEEELTEKQKKEADKRAKEAARQRLADKRAVVAAIDLEIAAATDGTEQMLELRKAKIDAQRQVELEQNRQKVASERLDEAAINAKYDKMKEDAVKKYYKDLDTLRIQNLQAEQAAMQAQLQITEKGTQEELSLRLALLNKQEELELTQNKTKVAALRQSEASINAKYDALRLKAIADFDTKMAQRELAASQDLAEQEFELLDKNERQKTIFRLQQEKARLQALLEINKTAAEKMTDTEVKAMEVTIDAIDKKVKSTGYDNIYEVLGISISKKQQSALDAAFSSVKDSLGEIADSWLKVAEASVKAADAQVEAAQKTLDAEIEARNAGYANEVATAQKELALAKKNQDEALKEQERAKKAQLSLDTITQASSLVTAAANIWAAFGGIPVVGPALAAAAIVTMFGSFAVAKVKAAQATKTEQYGEGTLELLEGGSHASGHDVDLGRKADGTRRRAEGGEYFAVINKRNSRRYRSLIPDVINSLNDGTFAEKYQRAGESLSGLMVAGGGTDVSGIAKDVESIRKQGEEVRYTDGAGNTIVRYKNLTRKIKS